MSKPPEQIQCIINDKVIMTISFAQFLTFLSFKQLFELGKLTASEE